MAVSLQPDFYTRIFSDLAKTVQDVSFYSGAIPADSEAVPEGDLLVSMGADILAAASTNAFIVSGNTATWSYTTTDEPPLDYVASVVTAAGMASFARVKIFTDSNYPLYFDLTVGAIGSGAEIELPIVNLASGDFVRINSGSIAITLAAG